MLPPKGEQAQYPEHVLLPCRKQDRCKGFLQIPKDGRAVDHEDAKCHPQPPSAPVFWLHLGPRFGTIAGVTRGCTWIGPALNCPDVEGPNTELATIAQLSLRWL